MRSPLYAKSLRLGFITMWRNGKSPVLIRRELYKRSYTASRTPIKAKQSYLSFTMAVMRKQIIDVDEAFGRRMHFDPFENLEKDIAYCIHSHRQPDSPFLNWSSLQPLLETAVPYVLIILDCCFAATAARDTTEGTTKEILAACGRESPTHGVGQRSFTSALIEEMQAFEEGEYFTAAMLHSRLVTMRWRLAFTPIYALLSEHGGNSITICPFSDGRASVRPASILAELEATGDPREEQGSMTMDDSPSPQISQKPAADTRVLLSVSVVQDAVHDVSQWVSWLTTRAPWDVTKVNVQVHSIFKSHSTLIIVSVPTCAWNRLPERPAYRFIGFIRSGDDFQAAKCSTAAITETIPFAVDEMKMPKPVDAARAMIYPSKSQSGFQTETEAQSISQRHKRQRANMVDRPTAKVWRRSPRFSVSGASRSPKKTPESGFCSQKPRPVWPPENEERDRADNIKMEGFEKAYIDRLLLRVQPHPGRHIYPIN